MVIIWKSFGCNFPIFLSFVTLLHWKSITSLRSSPFLYETVDRFVFSVFRYNNWCTTVALLCYTDFYVYHHFHIVLSIITEDHPNQALTQEAGVTCTLGNNKWFGQIMAWRVRLQLSCHCFDHVLLISSTELETSSLVFRFSNHS